MIFTGYCRHHKELVHAVTRKIMFLTILVTNWVLFFTLLMLLFNLKQLALQLQFSNLLCIYAIIKCLLRKWHHKCWCHRGVMSYCCDATKASPHPIGSQLVACSTKVATDCNLVICLLTSKCIIQTAWSTSWLASPVLMGNELTAQTTSSVMLS